MSSNFRVRNDGRFNSLSSSELTLPVYFNVINIPVPEAGNIAYDILTSSLYFSDGINWNQLSTGTVTLPASLQSIANLTTTGGEMLFTIAPDTYNTLITSTLGRGWLGLNTASDQRTAIGLVIGSDVQAHSNVLDNFVSNSTTSEQVLYSNGSGYSLSPSQSFGRSLLNTSNAAAVNSILGTISGSVSTLDSLLRVSGSNTVQESGVTIDLNDDISGIRNLSLTGNLDGITPSERTQLANINGSIISTSNWQNLSNLNQNVSTTSTPTFQGLSSSNQRIMNVLNPINPQDSATKDYVDTTAASGAPPLQSVNYATAAALTLTPAYAAVAETLTATLPGLLTVDGNNPPVGDRILVKDQADQRTNGVYVVTDDGASPGPLYVLTRSTDFNQASMPKPAGTSVFVEIIPGTTNGGSTWSLSQTVNNVDPLTDNVIFVQTAGSQQLTAGQGINSASLIGGTVEVENTARFTYLGNALELNTVTVPFGGTGLTTVTSGNVMVGNGAGNVDDSKVAPTGDFVGTTDVQTLANKVMTSSTNNVAARGLFSGSGTNIVDVFNSTNPLAGYVLTATSATTSDWQPPSTSTFTRSLNVFQGAPNVSPNFSSFSAAIAEAVILVPTSTNWVDITVYPGSYSESIPLIVPSFVSISSSSISAGDVIISPNSAVASEIFRLSGNTRLAGLLVDGLGTATIGYRAETGAVSSIDICNNCTAQNVINSGFLVRGNGTQFSRILICRTTLSRSLTGVMTNGYDVTNGAILSGYDLNATAFAGVGTLTVGYNIQDDFSFMDVSILAGSFCNTGVKIGPGSSSLVRADYPRVRVAGANLGFCFQIGLLLDVRSVARVSDFRIEDTFFPIPIHIQINNPNSGEGNLLVGLWTDSRLDKFVPNANGGSVLPTILGSNLSEVPQELAINVAGSLSVGLPANGFESVFGSGDSHTLEILVFRYDSGTNTSTDLTTDVKNRTTFDVFPPTPELNDAFYVSGVATNGLFPGIKIGIVTSIVSTGGVLTDVGWEYWDGSSWVPLILMSTLADSPYSNRGNITFGQGDTIVTSLDYQYRFLPSDWVTTLAGAAGIVLPGGVPDVSRYYIRARVLNSLAITTIPQVNLIKLGTNRTEIEKDGFNEYYGLAEPLRNFVIPSPSFLPTGVGGETAPGNQSLTFSTTNSIVATVPNCDFGSGVNTTFVSKFAIPGDMDTSRGIQIFVKYSKAAGNNGNLVLQFDYTVIQDDDLIGNPSGGAANPVFSTGAITIPVTTVQRGYVSQFLSDLSVSSIVPEQDITWIKFYRRGNDAADTYNQSIYITGIDILYYSWK